MGIKITRIKSVTAEGRDCPDGDTCPTLWATDTRKRLVSGRPVTDPDVLRQLNLPDGEIAVEVPEELLEDP